VLRAFDRKGKRFELQASGFTARVIQHETDHLDGVLFIDRLDPEARKAAMAEIRQSEWFGLEQPTVKLSPHPTRGMAL
jgi:peptide deformylase